jgi:osmotically-inducible protein OsmY
MKINSHQSSHHKGRFAITVGALVLVASQLSGCAVAVMGTGMAMGALVATDRRTTGAQLEDQNIELKASGRIGTALKQTGHVNVTSYNRRVLLTGEVATEADRATVESIIVDIENVRGVVNELLVLPVSSITQRTNDAIITGRMKAALIDAKLGANVFKVVTERGVVYLMGRVTNIELDIASKAAQGISGVTKVVRTVEILTPAEQEKLRKEIEAKRS